MADLPISGLPAATSLTASDAIPTVQGGTTVRTNPQAIKDFVAETSIAFKGNVLVPAGSRTAPGLQVAGVSNGLYTNAGDLKVTVNGTPVATFTSVGQLYVNMADGSSPVLYTAGQPPLIYGYNSTGPATIDMFRDDISGSNICGARFRTYSSNNTGPTINMSKARGVSTSILPTASGDNIGILIGQGAGTTSFVNAARIVFSAIETFSDTAAGSRVDIRAAASGATSQTEIARYEVGTGFSMYGANKVINQERAIMFRTYTVAGVSALQAVNTGAGGAIYITNPGSGASRPYWSDGANFKDAAGVTLA